MVCGGPENSARSLQKSAKQELLPFVENVLVRRRNHGLPWRTAPSEQRVTYLKWPAQAWDEGRHGDPF